MKRLGASILILLIAIVSILHFYGPTVGARFGMPIYLFPPSAERYGKIAIEIMDSDGYYATNSTWEEQKEKAMSEIESVSSVEETYQIIEESLKVAGGKHSFLMLENDFQEQKGKDEMPVSERLEDIAIIKLPAIIDAQNNGKEYAERILTFLHANQDIKGVVIDLQNNTGGDMGPMVTSVSPLLPDGEILFFKDGQNKYPVTLKNGQVTGGGTEVVTTIEPFKLDVPVALLTDEKTASSAEALLMSFIDLDRVQTFGQSTAGYASANASYPLFDGTTMLLTTAFNQTPKGQIFYEEPIPVAHETENPLEEAINWLKNYSS